MIKEGASKCSMHFPRVLPGLPRHPILSVGTQRVALDHVSMRLRIKVRNDTNAF